MTEKKLKLFEINVLNVTLVKHQNNTINSKTFLNCLPMA